MRLCAVYLQQETAGTIYSHLVPFKLAYFWSQVSVLEAALLEASKVGIWSRLANSVYIDGHSLLAGMAQWRMAAP